MSVKIPRMREAIAVPSKEVWDVLATAVEKHDKLRVAAPLELRDTQSGPLLSVAVDSKRGVHFAVKVEKTGGTEVSSPTDTANWTYTVRRIDWTGTGTSADFELGTVVPQTKPRPKGKMIFQVGTTGYGVAFYNEAGTLILWDAGEVPETGDCTAP